MANYTDYTAPANSNCYWVKYSSGTNFNEFCAVGYQTSDGTNLQGAIRFTGVTIPQGSSIYSAIWRFYGQVRIGPDTIQAKAWGIDEDNTAIFSGDPFGRPKTTADTGAISWSGGSGQYWDIGVGGIVEEIVSRPGWSSGNAMGFFIEDNGTTHSNTNYYYDKWDSTNSVLSILYSANPDFYPNQDTVYLKNDVPVQSYGKKIANYGEDVLTKDRNILSHNSAFPMPKRITSGYFAGTAVKNVFHNTGNAPSALLYGIDHNTGRRYAAPNFGLHSGDPTLSVISNSNHVTLVAAGADQSYYEVFADGIETS